MALCELRYDNEEKKVVRTLEFSGSSHAKKANEYNQASSD